MYLRIVLTAILSNLVLSKAQRILVESGEESELVSNFLETGHPLMISVFFFLIIVIAPSIEEVLFRGFLWKILSYVLPGKVVYLVVALVFSALHAWPGGLFLLPIALYLSHLRFTEESIEPCIVFHIVFNATGILLPFIINRAII